MRLMPRPTCKRAGGDGTKARAASPTGVDLGARKILSAQSNLAPKTLAAPLLPHHQRDCIPSLPQFSSIANMGFTDFVSDAGLTLLNNWVKTRSYIVG